MLQRVPFHSEVERRERERSEADALYNDALTALDRALPSDAGPAPPPPAPDDQQMPALNERWQIVPPGSGPPGGRGLRTRLAEFVWRLVAPYLERQQSFNSILVDHLNRNTRAQQALVAWMADARRSSAESSAALARFHAQLILYLQQITLYVDSKDRALGAGLRSVVDALADELLRGTESIRARERRLEDIRDTLTTLQQRTLMLKREVEGLAAERSAAAAPPGLPAAPHAPQTGSAGTGVTASIDSYKYVGFEDLFRGSQADVRQRQADYVDDFRGAADVLDIGCGRGEFLGLLRDAGIAARGIDSNHAMVQACRERGLAAEEADALAYLESLPDASLGGVFAAQVVEHLQPAYLVRLLETAWHKLRPGSKIVLETINPGSWIAFFESYIRDLTHEQPIHPDTLKYLLGASGFHDVEIRYRSPYPDAEKLQPAAAAEGDSRSLHEIVDTYNANLGRLNALIFSHLDYAAVGERR
jgi:O-antigen chain-terminating methyltransferase